MFRLLGAWALACARGHGLDDAVALHQRVLDLPLIERMASSQGRTQPSAEQRQKAQSVLDLVVGKGIDRTLENLKLTSTLGATRWPLLSAITQWAMDKYSQPKSAAHLEFLNGVIDIFGKAFVSAHSDEELLAGLVDVARIHQLARRFAEQTGAPQATIQLIDVAKQAADTQRGGVTVESFPKVMEAIAEPFRGQPLADMLLYANAVGKNHSTYDEAVLHKLLARVEEQFHLPPAAATALEGALDSSRRHAPPSADGLSVKSLREGLAHMLELQHH